MKHETVRKKLLRYLDGDLPEKERLTVRSHLRNCRSCRDDLKELEEVWKADPRAERIAAPPFLWARISAALNEREQRERFPVAAASLISSLWRPAAAFAAMVLLMTGGVKLGDMLTVSPAEFEELQVSGAEDYLGMSYFEVLPPGSIGSRVLAPDESGVRR